MPLVRMCHEFILLPQFRRKVAIGRSHGIENGLDEISHGTGVTRTGGVGYVENLPGPIEEAYRYFTVMAWHANTNERLLSSLSPKGGDVLKTV
jgi:hypothetical protein